MRIKNAFKILVSDSGVIYKAVFFKLIATCVIWLIAYFAVLPLLNPILQSQEISDLWKAVVKTFTGFFAGDGFDNQIIPQAFDNLLALLKSNQKNIAIAITAGASFIFVSNVVDRMCNYGIALLYHGYMSALTKFSLVPSLLANFGKALLYSIIIAVIIMVFDALILNVALLIGIYGIRVFSILAIIFAVLFIVLALSFKYAVLSKFLPNLVVGKQKVGEGFCNTFKGRKELLKLTGNYAFLVMISFYVNVSVAVFTLGVGLFFSAPLMYNMIILVSLVDYYNDKGKKFYTAQDNVVIPKHLKQNAELLKYM